MQAKPTFQEEVFPVLQMLLESKVQCMKDRTEIDEYIQEAVATMHAMQQFP